MKAIVFVLIMLVAAPVWARDHVLSWTAPTTNTNGTRLTDLKGFRVGYDILPPGAPCAPPHGRIRYWVDVGKTTVLDLTTDPNFQVGLRYFFTIVAYTSGGEANVWGVAQSALSNGACLTITPPDVNLDGATGSSDGYGYDGSGDNGNSDGSNGYSFGSNQDFSQGADFIPLGTASFATEAATIPGSQAKTSAIADTNEAATTNGKKVSENVQYVKFKPRQVLPTPSGHSLLAQAHIAAKLSGGSAADASNTMDASSGENIGHRRPIKAKHQIVYYVSAALALFVALGWTRMS